MLRMRCGETLEPRARQLPDESVVMRYPTRAYQTDQPSACRPFCYQHIVRTRIFYKPLDRSNTYQCSASELTEPMGLAIVMLFVPTTERVMKTARPIELSSKQRIELERMVRSQTLEVRAVRRA